MKTCRENAMWRQRAGVMQAPARKHQELLETTRNQKRPKKKISFSPRAI